MSGLLAHDPAGTQNLSETLAAKNAKFKIDGLAVSKPSNIVTDTLPDMVLTLSKTNAGAPVTVSTARGDATSLLTAVDAFVKSYNDLNKTISDLTVYDQNSGAKGILLGDSAVHSIQSRLRAALSTSLTGVGALNNLSQVGITFQKDGSLTLDAGKLQSVISANPDGIATLFTAIGKPSDSLIKLAGTTSRTKPGNYPVDITTLPAQGKATASAAVSASLTISAGVNDQLAITLDNASGTITLPPGSYTAIVRGVNSATGIGLVEVYDVEP